MMLAGCKECGCTGVAEINLENYRRLLDLVLNENAELKAKTKELEYKLEKLKNRRDKRR